MNWTALIGSFSEINDDLIFRGRKVTLENEETRSDFATIISDQYFSGGKISADIMFKKVESQPANQCEIIVYYDPNTRHFLSAGLGGSFYMYSIRSFTSKWENHGLSGTYSNLKANKIYQVEVELKGSKNCPNSGWNNCFDDNFTFCSSDKSSGSFLSRHR